MSLIFFLVAIFKGVSGLRLVRLDVPSAVILGQPVWLNCSFDLEEDELYSLKWYRNNVEFYRYLPSDVPPAQKYDLKGVNIELSRSLVGNVHMTTSDLATEGNYRCEVSTEAPSFQTVRDNKDLKVYVLPQEGPRIAGTRPQYRVGDIVNTSCTSGPSKPPAVLKWFVNGRRATSHMEHGAGNQKQNELALKSSVLWLTFLVEPSHFGHGVMKLRCTALISEAYSMSSEEVIVGDDAMEHYLASSTHFGGDEGDGPTISGGQPRYQVGDMVHVNCTAARSKPAAELNWYLNDRKVPNEYVVYFPSTPFPDGQVVSRLGLRFGVRPSHFQHNEMRLKCTATLSKVINTSSMDTVLGSSQQSSLLHLYENSAAESSRSCGESHRLSALGTTSALAVLLLAAKT